MAEAVGFAACGWTGRGSDSPPGCHSLPRRSNPPFSVGNKNTPHKGGTVFVWRRRWDSPLCGADRARLRQPTGLSFTPAPFESPLFLSETKTAPHKGGLSLFGGGGGIRRSAERTGRGSDSPLGCHSLPRRSNPTILIEIKTTHGTSPWIIFIWRRRWDSNPRRPCGRT